MAGAVTVSASICVAAGGAAGALLRFWLGAALPPPEGGVPQATLAANLVGSLALGLLVGWLLRQQAQVTDHPAMLLLGVGLLGGFTTFSSFSLELVSLIERGATAIAALYAGLSLFGGLAMAWAGLALARWAP
jgi:CrcB protein